MIYIGCDTWSNHPLFTKDPKNHNYKNKSTLANYAKHLNCVEGDFPFYYIPTVKALTNWSKQVPPDFQFILKANRRMTMQDYNQHTLLKNRYGTAIAFDKNMQCLMKSHQLLGLLLQFPSSFYNTQFNRQYIQKLRNCMPDLPLAIEFRSMSWYQNKQTILSVGSFLSKLGISEVMIDEPHNQYTGAPFIPIITSKQFALFRLQGQNTNGWKYHSNGADWRNKRNLYCYSHSELTQLARIVVAVSKHSKNVCVIFNNNSGRDAAPNAMELKRILRKSGDLK